jgi:hypothetical protein
MNVQTWNLSDAPLEVLIACRNDEALVLHRKSKNYRETLNTI